MTSIILGPDRFMPDRFRPDRFWPDRFGGVDTVFLSLTTFATGYPNAQINDGEVTFTMTDNADGYDGVDVLTTAYLGAGPGLVAFPAITGTAAVGEVLGAVVSLWVGIAGPLAVTHQWLRDGVPIAGATGLTYTVVSADQDTDLTRLDTATDANGARVGASNAISIPAAGNTFADDFEGHADEVELDTLAAFNSELVWDGTNKLETIGGEVIVAASGGYTRHVVAAAGTWADNQFIEVTIAEPGAGSGGAIIQVYVCWTDDSNYYAAEISEGGLSFNKKNGGAWSWFGGGVTFAAGDVVRLERSGSAVRVLKNGVETNSVTDSDHTGGKIAFGIINSATQVTTPARIEAVSGGDL